MRKPTAVFLVTVAIALAATALAQQGGGSIGTISWDSNSPSGDDQGNLAGSGSVTWPSGWGDPSCPCIAMSSSDMSNGSGLSYDLSGSVTPTGDYQGTWSGSASVPADTYTVIPLMAVIDGMGDSQTVAGPTGSAQVGGNQKKPTAQGTVVITTTTAKSGTVTASGTFSANKGWQIKTDGFRALIIPVNVNIFGQWTSIDSSRLAIPGTVTIDPLKGTWNTTITGASSGYYVLFVRSTISNIADQTQVQTPATLTVVQMP